MCQGLLQTGLRPISDHSADGLPSVSGDEKHRGSRHQRFRVSPWIGSVKEHNQCDRCGVLTGDGRSHSRT